MAKQNRSKVPDTLSAFIENKAAIDQFWFLHCHGRNAAVDINCETGLLVLVATESDDGARGLGSIPQSLTGRHLRLMVTNNSKFSN